MPSIFTELEILRKQIKEKDIIIQELQLKLEKYNYYKNKCNRLKKRLRKCIDT